MTPETIQAMLARTGVPVSCGPFPDTAGQSAPAPPFIIWETASDDLYADNSNFAGFSALTVELYTRRREFAREAALEEILRENDLPWQKDTDRMEKERLHVTTYEMTVEMDG